MDPQSCLMEIFALYESLGRPAPSAWAEIVDSDDERLDALSELYRHCEALSSWLRKGGFPPHCAESIVPKTPYGHPMRSILLPDEAGRRPAFKISAVLSDITHTYHFTVIDKNGVQTASYPLLRM